jgi:branched-chain amino acid transport system permease protein
MTAEFWVTQAFNGVSYGALLFLLASGLSLIFGVMRIVNLAHGSYFMLGGYVGLEVVKRTGSFVAALACGALAIAVIGIGMERLFLRWLPAGQPLGQVLMTIGFALIFQDLALLIWEGDPHTIPAPAVLRGVVRVGGFTFPTYRVFIVGIAFVIGALPGSPSSARARGPSSGPQSTTRRWPKASASTSRWCRCSSSRSARVSRRSAG